VRRHPIEEIAIVASLPRSISALALALSLAGALVACGPRIPDTLKIGVAEPLSGPSAARGQDVVNGAKLAAADINEAKKVAEALIQQGVIAVIGHLSSDITEAVIPIYAKANIPQMFTSTAVELTALGQGNAFRLIGNDALQARAIASYTGDTLRAKKVAILYEKTAFGTPLAEGITAGLVERGKKVELSESVDTKTVNFAAYIAKLKAARPDVFVVVIRDNQLLPLFDQMFAAGLGDITVVASHVAKTEKMLAAPANVKTLYVTSSSADVSEFRGGRQFLEKFRAVGTGLGGALRLRRGLRPVRDRATYRFGRPRCAAGQAEDHRRDRAGDRHHALQRRRRATLRRDQRLPEGQREVGAGDAVGPLVNRAADLAWRIAADRRSPP